MHSRVMSSLDMQALSSDSRFISLSQKHVLLGGEDLSSQ
jgi:hypothetical protein